MFDKDQQKLAFLLEDITGIAPDFGNSNYGDRGRFSYTAANNDDAEIKKIDKQIEQKARRQLMLVYNYIKNSYTDSDLNVKEIDPSGIEYQIDNIKDKFGINMVKSMKQILDNDDTAGYKPEHMMIYNILVDYLSKNEDEETTSVKKEAIDMLNSYFIKELKTGVESMEFTKEIQSQKSKGNLNPILKEMNFIKNSPSKFNEQQRRGASQLIDRIRWFI